MNRTDENPSNLMLMAATESHQHHPTDMHSSINPDYNIADNDLMVPESSLTSNFSSLPLKHDSMMSRSLHSADYLTKDEFIHQMSNDVPLNLQATGSRYRSPRMPPHKVSLEDTHINSYDLKNLSHDIQDLSFSEELPPFNRSMNLSSVNPYYYKPLDSNVDVYNSDFSDEFSNDNFCPLPSTSTIFPPNDASASYLLPEPQSDELLLNSIELNDNEKLLLSNEDLALLTQGKQGCCLELILNNGEVIYTVVDSEGDYDSTSPRLLQDSPEILSSVRPFEADLSAGLVDHVSGPTFESSIATSSTFDPRASPITTFHNDGPHYPSVISSSLGKSIASTSANDENFNLCVDFSAEDNDNFHAVIDPYQPVASEKSSMYTESLMPTGQTSHKEAKPLPSQPVSTTSRVPSKMDYFPSAVNSIVVSETGKKYPKKYSFYSNISSYMNQDSFDKGDSEKITKSDKVINVCPNTSLSSIASTSRVDSVTQSCANVNVSNAGMEIINRTNLNETLQFQNVSGTELNTQPVEKENHITETIVLEDDINEIDGIADMSFNHVMSADLPTSQKTVSFQNGNISNKFLNSFSEIGVTSICDRPVQTRARATLPDTYLSINRIKHSKNTKIEYGVFARKTIPIRTQFGPVEGVLVKDEADEEASSDHCLGLQLTVEMETGKFYKLDVSNEDTCNWMKFVRPATTSKEQNLVVSQQGTSLYFTTIDVVQPMQELLVWYSEGYAQTRNYKLLSTNSCPGIAYEMTSTDHQEPIEPEILSSVVENNKVGSVCESSSNIEPTDSEKKIEDESSRPDSGCLVNGGHGEVNPMAKKPKTVTVSTTSVKKNDKSKKSLWLCTHCDLSFSNASVMNLHVLAHNDNGEEDSMSDSCVHRGDEQLAVVNEDLHECPQCYVKFDDKKDLILHVAKHGLKVHRWADNATNSSTDHEKNVENGNIENFNTKNFKCGSCDKSFKTALALEIHSRFHTDTAILECPMCEMTFKKLMDMKEHVRTHAVNGIFTCPHCPKTLDQYKYMRKHIRACHSKTTFCCKLCKRPCKSQYKLRSHMLRHSDERDFLCSICGKLFKRKDKLSDHMKNTHSEAREKHKMELVIKQEVKLKESLNKKLPNKVLSLITENVDNYFYKCYICNIGFKRRGMLVNHLNLFHPAVRLDTIPELNVPIQKAYCDFYCLYCDKVYKSNSKRKEHILKSHPGAKLPGTSERGSVLNDPFAKQVGNVISNPFNCEFCHRQYASRAKMLNHQRKNHADLLPADSKAPGRNAKKKRKKETKLIQPDDNVPDNESNVHPSGENLPLPSMEFVTGGAAALPETVTTSSILPPSIPPIQSITATSKQEDTVDVNQEVISLSHLLGDDGRNTITQEQYVKLLQSSNNLSLSQPDENSTALLQQILTTYTFPN